MSTYIKGAILGSLALLLLAPQAGAACLPSQSCDVQTQQQRVQDLQRQTDAMRSSVARDEQELQRARSDLRLRQSSTLPLQRHQERERVKDARDNLRDSQRDYWQSQNQLLDSRRSLQRMQQPTIIAPRSYQTR
jgi:gas vesicle protein